MRESNDFRDYYKIIQNIGKGYFGSVYEVETKDTKEKRALKLIDKNIILEMYLKINISKSQMKKI